MASPFITTPPEPAGKAAAASLYPSGSTVVPTQQYRIQTAEVVAMARMVPVGIDFWASRRSPERLEPAMIPVNRAARTGATGDQTDWEEKTPASESGSLGSDLAIEICVRTCVVYLAFPGLNSLICPVGTELLASAFVMGLLD